MPAVDPVYVQVSIPATDDQVAQVMRAAEAGHDVYAVNHLCHTRDGRQQVMLSLRAAGVSPEVARALGWSPGFPEDHRPPGPTQDVIDTLAELAAAEVDPNATTVVLERDECLVKDEDPAPVGDVPVKSSGRSSRQR